MKAGRYHTLIWRDSQQTYHGFELQHNNKVCQKPDTIILRKWSSTTIVNMISKRTINLILMSYFVQRTQGATLHSAQSILPPAVCVLNGMTIRCWHNRVYLWSKTGVEESLLRSLVRLMIDVRVNLLQATTTRSLPCFERIRRVLSVMHIETNATTPASHSSSAAMYIVLIRISP